MSLSLLPANGSSEPARQNQNLTTIAQPPPGKDTSLSYPYPPNRPNTTVATVQPYTVSRPPGPTPFNLATVTGPTVPSVVNPVNKVNDFGAYPRPGPKSNATIDHPGFPVVKSSQPPVQKPVLAADTKPALLGDALPKPTPRPARPVANPIHRLTVTNNDEPEKPMIKGPQTPKHNHTASGGGSSRTPWPTAEEEKKRLYEKARADVERVQGSLARGTSANSV